MSKRTVRPAAGFTLVEMMVVVGIIALLTGLLLAVTPKVYRAVYGARTQAQLAAIATAIQAYDADYHSYPGPLANNQLGVTYATGVKPFVYSNAGTAFNLQGTGVATSLDPTKITGAENLVLGLVGGLRVLPNGTTPPYDVSAFVYDPTMIYPDGQTATPTGAASLNINSPRQQHPYLQIKPGDLSVPNYTLNSGCFTDAANRPAGDSCIPEFLDKYGDPLPILYYRTNVGAKAIAGMRSNDDNGTALQDSNPLGFAQSPLENPQFDLVQNLAYVSSKIGTVAGNAKSYHGLQGLGKADLSDPIMTNGAPTNNGKNGIAFMIDPNFSTKTDFLATNTHAGVARQKDGFILLSAGPDRLYGTPSNLIYPGTVTNSN